MSGGPRISPQPVLVVMGVSGAGKTTVAGILADRLRWDFVEGDDLHPATNVAKMSAGISLTDEDRWPWLARVATWIQDHGAAGIPGIITCSALKRVYRDMLAGDNVVFVALGRFPGCHRTASGFANGSLHARILTRLPDFDAGAPGEDENALSVLNGSAPAEAATGIIRRLGITPGADATLET